ncbi:MAG TPA: TetR family transcriptional regulator [Puia sp.]|nr:TetR family transcriptional regulator [Puia sp.]
MVKGKATRSRGSAKSTAELQKAADEPRKTKAASAKSEGGPGKTAARTRGRATPKAAWEKEASTRGRATPKAAREKEASTEERIKEAARKLFTQKGFAATRTRDIAEEAGLNLALLNYYFRSKQRLFDIIMMENFQHFIQGLSVNFIDDTLTMDQRVQKMVTAYVDFLTRFPDLPLFILNEIKGNPSKLAAKIREELAPARSHLFQQLRAAHQAGRIALDPFHFITNLVGLTVFPFAARPLLQRVNNVTDEEFLAYMQERKRLVPVWIKMMMAPAAAPPEENH